MCKLKHILSSHGKIAIKKSPVNYLKKKKEETFIKHIITESLSLYD